MEVANQIWHRTFHGSYSSACTVEKAVSKCYNLGHVLSSNNKQRVYQCINKWFLFYFVFECSWMFVFFFSVKQTCLKSTDVYIQLGSFSHAGAFRKWFMAIRPHLPMMCNVWNLDIAILQLPSHDLAVKQWNTMDWREFLAFIWWYIYIWYDDMMICIYVYIHIYMMI